MFWQNFQIPCVFPHRDSFWPFSLFSLCSEDPGLGLRTLSAPLAQVFCFSYYLKLTFLNFVGVDLFTVGFECGVFADGGGEVINVGQKPSL